jgi:hypothetical protein
MEVIYMADKKNNSDNQQNVPLSELLNDSFISNHSSFSNLGELMGESGFPIESQDDFEAIPEEQWDAFIKQNTSFENWKEMLNAAGEEWIKKK